MRSYSDAASYALANLRRHRLRTALTMCGVGVGVATLAVMVSLGSGLRQLAASNFDQAELVTRITVMRAGAKEALQAGIFGGNRGKKPDGLPVTDAVIAELAKIDGVVAAYPEIRTPITLEANATVAPGVVEALPVSALTQTFHDSLAAGSYWDADGATGVCVLPSLTLDDLGYATAQDAVGTRIAVTRYQNAFRYRAVTKEVENPDGGEPLTETTFVRPDGIEVVELDVIGVYDSKAFGYTGRFVHVPTVSGRDITAQFGFRRAPDGEYQSAVVKVADHLDLDPIREQIEAKGFDTSTVFDVLAILRVVFAVFQLLLSFFGGIGLFVAFFGIVNTMLMAVLERTREIGVLKALGARDRDVRRVFTTEAAAIGFGGGVLGLGVGWAIGQILNAVARMTVVEDPTALGDGVFVIEWWLALGALGLATAVAIGAGLYPAWRAARLDPVEALRRD